MNENGFMEECHTTFFIRKKLIFLVIYVNVAFYPVESITKRQTFFGNISFVLKVLSSIFS